MEQQLDKYPMRMWGRFDCVVFRKTHDKWGELSNMAGGFPLQVNGFPIRTAEALYQACRFPRLPYVQWGISDEKSPMAAKMVGKPFRHKARRDWDDVRVDVMRWCLEVKLAQHLESLGKLLLETDGHDIVEHSRRDDFWGAKAVGYDEFRGHNVLGNLLMELRDRVGQLKGEELLRVEPLEIPEFTLYGEPIEPVDNTGEILGGERESDSIENVPPFADPKQLELQLATP